MKILAAIIVTFLTSSVFSKCDPSRYTLDGYVGAYPRMDISVACKVKTGDLLDYCNGEACDYLAYPKAIRSVKLYIRPDVKSDVIGELRRCEVIKNFKRKSILKKFGEAIALTDIPGWELKKGDIIKFAWTQEGHNFGCVKNHPVFFYASSPHLSDQSCFQEKTLPVAENWVSHTASNGKTGFSKIESDPFYVGYSGSRERCP